ncbi:YybH family protein [Maribellus mangrovi]|uniref:YybH family protein n=1 Tax=Maribellus mangrovi TaxID=3133146 RepID=UPI0030EE0C48
MNRILLLLVLSTFALSVSAKNELTAKERSAVLAVLEKQKEAWNAGNLEIFMETYWHSDQLAFVGGNGPVYGWDATLERYKKGYPDKKAMGHLEFKVLRLQKIDKKTAFLIGRYELTREIGDAAGHFTLVIQKIDGQWKIVSDHSSAEN